MIKEVRTSVGSGRRKTKISKCLDLFDWDFALRNHSYEDLEIMLGVSKNVIQLSATVYHKRKIIEKEKMRETYTPLYRENEDDLKCNNAWGELKETNLYKQLNNKL